MNSSTQPVPAFSVITITHDVPETTPDGKPLAWHGIGNAELLSVPDKVALFASRRCDGDTILKLLDRARELRETGLVVVSGFQSPVEKECLTILLRSRQSRLIIMPARGLIGMRIPQAWRGHLNTSRLLILSPFPPTMRRPDRPSCELRNQLTSTIAQGKTPP